MCGLKEESMEERIKVLEKRVKKLSELSLWLIRSISFSSQALKELDEITKKWEQEDEEDNIGDTK